MRRAFYMLTDEELADLQIVVHLALHGVAYCRGVNSDRGMIEVTDPEKSFGAISRVGDEVAEAVRLRHPAVEIGELL